MSTEILFNVFTKVYLYCIFFVVIYCPFTLGDSNKNLEIIKTGVGEISPCYIGLQLYATLNNTGDEDFMVELISDECCINSDDAADYDSIQIMGQSSEVIEKGTFKTFTLVAPLLNPYERKGYCIVHVDSRPADEPSRIMRDTITIQFDTSLHERNDSYTKGIKKCHNVDEDPLNECKPVDCDIHYNGKKPIFDKAIKRCIQASKCTNKKSEDSVFDPDKHECSVVDPISEDDIEFIKSLNQDKTTAKDDSPVPTNSVMLSSPLVFRKFDTESTRKSNMRMNERDDKIKYIYGNIMKYLRNNKYTIVVLGIVIFVQCSLICGLIYCLTKRTFCKERKKVTRKYFNCRQDASVTTPLITTSNLDTGTVFDYHSDSSNVENKIKCYKSCLKEGKSDPKISMSDDILTKCLNRRNWNSKPKSDVTKDVNNIILNTIKPEWQHVEELTGKSHSPKQIENNNSVEHINEKIKEQDSHKTFNKQYDTKEDSSENIIKCHNYNVEALQVESLQSKRAISISSDKGAQAYFSNDSLDDFLSERGMTFLVGEELSKYSLATDITSTDRSSKTSKKHKILKSVLSYLSRKSKKQPTSDPGDKKEDVNKDLELIHMSKASMYSSSASSEYKMTAFRVAKDSRSSF